MYTKLRVRAALGAENKPIFVNKIHRLPVSIREAREAYDACVNITNPIQKEAMYLMFGVDGETTEKYIEVVERLETAYQKIPMPVPFNLWERMFWLLL